MQFSLDKPKDIKEWVKERLYLLDNPEVYVPDMNSCTHDWELEKEKQKVCLVSLVPYSAFIANLGVAILYDTLNRRVDDVICERAYYPEEKLKKRLYKENIPFFSKETFHSLHDFDILGFSSFYPLQFFGVPESIERSGMDPISKRRKEEDPLVFLGGVAAFNPSPVAPFFDAIFVGDGEEQFYKAIQINKKLKKEGKSKEEILFELTTSVDGIYVPSFYKEKYFPSTDLNHSNQVKEHVVIKEGAPAVIKKAVVDISKVKPLDRMFVSNSEGQAMSSGSLEITRGCGDKCLFCEGSYRSQPYRERGIAAIKEGFKNLILNTGVTAVTPYGFNLSDHSQVNNIVYFLMEDADRKVSMSSQRIDRFSLDFAKVAHASGNNSLTIAIESPTDRMRSKVSKNVSEPQILETFSNIFKAGFGKVKVYMIANLPGEEQVDIDYLVDLSKKIKDIQISIQGDLQKTKIRFSWTPFNSKAHSPLQYAKIHDIDEETGFPILPRTLDKVMDGLREVGYGFRVGTDSELSVINQCLSLGDRRMSLVIQDCYNSPDFNYKGAMSIGMKKPMEVFLEVLRKYGLDYKHFLREKDEEEVFSWDFIDMLLTKKFLKRAYFDNFVKGEDLQQCFKKCEGCGGCTDYTKEHFKKYWSNNIPKDDAGILKMLETRFKKQTVQKLRFKINVLEDFRFVDRSKIKNYIRRSFLRLGLPIRNKVSLASDRLKFNNWSFGVDYGEISTYSKVLPESLDIKKLNDAFDECQPFEFLSLESYSDTAGDFMQAFDNILYSVFVPSSFKDFNFINARTAEVLKSEEFVIKLKVLGEKRDTTQIIDFDARPFIEDMWAVNKDGGTLLYSLLKDKIGIYELFQKVFGGQKRKGLAFPVKRVGYLLAKNQDSLDMFSAVCSKCSVDIEEDVFGNQASEDLCIKCLNL